MHRLLAEINLGDPAQNPVAKVTNVGTIMSVLAPGALIIGGGISLVMLFMGAFTYITAGGEPEHIQKAKRTITFAIIGLVIMFSATLFVNIISYFLGVNSFFKK